MFWNSKWVIFHGIDLLEQQIPYEFEKIPAIFNCFQNCDGALDDEQLYTASLRAEPRYHLNWHSQVCQLFCILTAKKNVNFAGHLKNHIDCVHVMEKGWRYDSFNVKLGKRQFGSSFVFLVILASDTITELLERVKFSQFQPTIKKCSDAKNECEHFQADNSGDNHFCRSIRDAWREHEGSHDDIDGGVADIKILVDIIQVRIERGTDLWHLFMANLEKCLDRPEHFDPDHHSVAFEQAIIFGNLTRFVELYCKQLNVPLPQWTTGQGVKKKLDEKCRTMLKKVKFFRDWFSLT